MSVPTTKPTPSKANAQQILSIPEFKNTVYNTLSKFGDNATVKYASDEMREIMAE